MIVIQPTKTHLQSHLNGLVTSLGDHLNSQNLLVKNKHEFYLCIYTNNFDFSKKYFYKNTKIRFFEPMRSCKAF